MPQEQEMSDMGEAVARQGGGAFGFLWRKESLRDADVTGAQPIGRTTKQGVLKEGPVFIGHALRRPNQGAFTGQGQTEDGAEQSAAAAQHKQALRIEFAATHQAERVEDASFSVIGSGVLKEQAKCGWQLVGADGFRAWRHRSSLLAQPGVSQSAP